MQIAIGENSTQSVSNTGPQPAIRFETRRVETMSTFFMESA